MSPSVAVKTTPFGNTKVFIVWLRTIYSVVVVSSARFGITPPKGHIYNAYSYVLSSPNIVVYSIINSSSALVMTLCIGSLLSRNSFSNVLAALDFLRACGDSLLCCLLPWGDFVVNSLCSYASYSFCLSCSEDISWSPEVSSTTISWVASCSEATFCPWHVLSASLMSRC